MLVFHGMWIVECGNLSGGNLRKIKRGVFHKLPLIASVHSAAKKFRISPDCKITVRSHCTTYVLSMHSSVRRPAVPSFSLCGLFAKEQGSFLWPPFVADADIIFLPCGVSSVFLYLFLFPRLISVIADWMSAILRHMVWP